jgi:4'-phosphopantetheinyl transferase
MNITGSGFQLSASLTLSEDEVKLWRVDLEATRSDESRWHKLLSPDESARAARYHFAADRQRYVASRAWLRTILASYLATDAQRLSFSYSKKEKPSLGHPYATSGIMFNVSHSADIALFAFTRRREIGVDVEKIRHDFDLEGISRRFFSTGEQSQLSTLPEADKAAAFFRCWTRKEAYIKATGDGLSLPLSQFDVSLAPGGKNALLATRPDESEAGRWLLHEVPAGPGYVAALCVRGRDWKLNAWSENLGSEIG